MYDTGTSAHWGQVIHFTLLPMNTSTFKGSKFSKSRGAAVDVPYFLSRYDPDALRYYLTATAPETRDTEFSWEDFVERNNNELVATWGNLANRMLSFAYKRFDGQRARAG